MRHSEKTYRVHFSPAQERACKLRRRLAAGLLSPERAMPDLVELLYGDDYTACTVAAQVLGEHGGPEAILPLIDTLLWHDEEQRYFSRQLRCAAVEALERLGRDNEMAANAILAARWDPDPAVAERATSVTFH